MRTRSQLVILWITNSLKRGLHWAYLRHWDTTIFTTGLSGIKGYNNPYKLLQKPVLMTISHQTKIMMVFQLYFPLLFPKIQNKHTKKTMITKSQGIKQKIKEWSYSGLSLYAPTNFWPVGGVRPAQNCGVTTARRRNDYREDRGWGKKKKQGTSPVYNNIMEQKWSNAIYIRVLLAGFTLCVALGECWNLTWFTFQFENV